MNNIIIYTLKLMSRKTKSKSFFALTMDEVEDLEEDLLKNNNFEGLDKSTKQLEEIFLENKVLDELIKE